MPAVAIERHAAAVQALGARLLAPVLGDPAVRAAGGDLACSPAGLWLALAAAAAGARGPTADELAGLLGVAAAEAGRAATEATRELLGTGALAVATGIRTRVPVAPAVRELLPDVGVGPVDQAAIDTWVRRATHGLIARLPVAAAPHDALVLVNALALRARWERPFPPHATLPRPFTPAVGATVPVATMQRPLPPDDVWTVGGVTVVELPCRAPRGRRPARVRFALGPAGAGAAEVVPATWARRGRGPDADVVELRLPRFELRGRLDLAEHLRALGASVALTPAADFSGLSPARPFVAQVVQEVLVRTAEKGIEAAAVTAVGMRAAAVSDRRRRVVVTFDRPFAVAVLDASGRVPLVVGWQATVPKGREPDLDDVPDG